MKKGRKKVKKEEIKEIMKEDRNQRTKEPEKLLFNFTVLCAGYLENV